MPACIESLPPHFVYKWIWKNTCCKMTSHLWRGRISTLLVWLGFRKLKLSLSRSQRDRWRLELHSCTSTFEHFEHTWTQVPESLAYLNTPGLNFFLLIISRSFTLPCSQAAEKEKEAGVTFFKVDLPFQQLLRSIDELRGSYLRRAFKPQTAKEGELRLIEEGTTFWWAEGLPWCTHQVVPFSIIFRVLNCVYIYNW